MASNPHRYVASVRQLDNRHATAGCMMVLLFALPFASNAVHIGVLSSAALVYVTLVVPLIAGYMTVGDVTATMRSILDARTLRYWLTQLRLVACWLHHVYMQLDSIHTTTNQILFFMAAEKLLCPDQRYSCLYVLLFFTVLAYLHRSLKARQWTQLMHETSPTDFLKLTTAFIVVRLGKAVALSLVLLSFTLQFNNLEPSLSFVILTAFYFLLTQYKGTSGQETRIVSWMKQLELQILEGFEEFWIPFLIRTAAIVLSSCLALAVRDYKFICASLCYTNMWVSWLQAEEHFWTPLSSQRAIVARFARATPRQMAEHGDYTCAVCLDEMRPIVSRVTNCGHTFHSQCLHKCVIQFGQCPLCKQPL